MSFEEEEEGSDLSLSLPRGDTVRRWPSPSLEAGCHQNPTGQHADFRRPISRSVRKSLSVVQATWSMVFVTAAQTDGDKHEYKNFRVKNTHFGAGVLSVKTGLCLTSCLLLGGGCTALGISPLERVST